MDATTLILLAKIASDLMIVITLGMPKVDTLSDDEKKALLKTLQDNTSKLTQSLMAMANQ